MESNLLIITALAIIAVVSVFAFISSTNKAKKSGKKLSTLETLAVITDIALPALRVGFDVAMAQRKADNGGFDAVKAATIAHVLNTLEEAGYSQLTAEELEHVLRYCEPLLEYLWKYKIEVPNKNIHPNVLREIRAELKSE